eukprot:TRINITY_DN9312_c0_g1_i2.p1 TRINITY_DN9312_c0_g1~~TRINITY_DN9312_c0_g1_i2.p1  ORF type:complete len:300 (+),score=31.41 TRINITY_DN9312_c0_g1_i2:47-946(+)
MGSVSLSVCLLLFALLQVVSCQQLIGVYYQVIGNGNMDAYLANIDYTNGTVARGSQIANIYATYGTPSAFDPVTYTYYWPYATYDTTLYTVPLGNGNLDPPFYFKNQTIGLNNDPSSNFLVALTSPENHPSTFYVVTITKTKPYHTNTIQTFELTNLAYIPMAILDKTFYFVVVNELKAFSLTSHNLTSVTLGCKQILQIFPYDTHTFLALSHGSANLKIDLVDITTGKCTSVISDIPNTPYDSYTSSSYSSSLHILSIIVGNTLANVNVVEKEIKNVHLNMNNYDLTAGLVVGLQWTG